MAEPTLTRAEFAQSIKAKYPVYAALSDEELATKMLATYPQYEAQIKKDGASAAPLVEHMGARPTGGYTVSDSVSTEHPVMEALSSAAHPKDIGDFLGLLVPSAVGEGAVTAPIKAYANAARAAYQRTGSLKSLPVQMLKELYWSAFGKAANGARLVKDPTNEFVQALNELRSMDTANAAVEKVGGSVKAAAAGKGRINVDPATVTTKSGPLTATLPDKFGMTAVQEPELARIAPNTAWTANSTMTIDDIVKGAKKLNPPGRLKLIEKFKDQPEIVAAIKKAIGMK